jgi:ribosomal protein S6
MDEMEKKEYELAVLVATEEDLAHVMGVVRQHNAEIVADFRAKKLALAYEIKRHKEGVFAHCLFKATGADAKKLEGVLNMDAKVIRSLMLVSPAPAMVLDRDRNQPSTANPRVRTSRPSASVEVKPAPSQFLSNEALEKKIEEILQ